MICWYAGCLHVIDSDRKKYWFVDPQDGLTILNAIIQTIESHECVQALLFDVYVDEFGVDMLTLKNTSGEFIMPVTEQLKNSLEVSKHNCLAALKQQTTLT